MLFDMTTCGGCRTCELACSYHHIKEFSASASSIKILNKEDGIGYRILFLEEDGEIGKACDGCAQRDIPYCVDYCKDPDEIMKMLKKLSKK